LGVKVVTIQNTKLRLVTIGLQFVAGVALLTASYFTTDADWSHQLINTATQQQITIKKCI